MSSSFPVAEVLARHLSMAVSCCDLDGRYRWVSDRYALLMNRPREAFLELRLHDVLEPDTLAAVLPLLERVRQGQPAQLKRRVTLPPHGERDIEVRYRPTFDDQGRVDGWVAELTDQTHRLRAARALRHSRELPRAIAAQLPHGAVFVVDHVLRYQLAEGGAMAAVGLKPEQLEGRTIAEALGAAMAAEYEPHYRAALAGHSFHAEHSVAGHYFVSHGVPLIGDDGRIEGALAVSYDITDRKRAEAALEHAGQLKDGLIAAVSHELRNPLAALRNGVAVLQSGKAEPDTRQRAVDVIDRQSAAMARLLGELLEHSRLTRGKVEIQRLRVTLADVVDEAVEAVRAQLDETDQQLQRDLPQSTVWLDADPLRLAQALATLMGNASRHSPRGGRVMLAARADQAGVEIDVTDEGSGIAADALPGLFDASPGPRGLAGFSLGLTLARQLVELHGGTLSAHSEGPGRGSRFTLRLPPA